MIVVDWLAACLPNLFSLPGHIESLHFSVHLVSGWDNMTQFWPEVCGWKLYTLLLRLAIKYPVKYYTHSLPFTWARSEGFCDTGATWWKESGSPSRLLRRASDLDQAMIWAENKIWLFKPLIFGTHLLLEHKWPYPNTMVLEKRNQICFKLIVWKQ